MTLISTLAMLLNAKISLGQRKMLMQSAGSLQNSGVIRLVKRVVLFTAIFETLGTIALCFRFVPQFGFWEGLYNAVFHSVSAFCNAGFDLMGKITPFSSFTSYQSDPLVTITLMVLVFVGGIGFLCWNEIVEHKGKFKCFSLHTKTVLIATVSLVAVSAFLFWLFERNYTMRDMTPFESVLASFFQAVTPRTAGFNTIDQAQMSEASTVLTSILMFIGGNSGSTAGGIKVTTFLVIIVGIRSLMINSKEISIAKRRLPDELLHQAYAILSMCLLVICLGTVVICACQPELTLKSVLFEVFSALGTVGLSLGITTQLNVVSQLMVMLLMYMGRVGMITIILAFSENKNADVVKYSQESILIG